MHSNTNKPVIYTPTLLGYQKLNPILYSRFVARRLKQRFNLFETMKVLKNYLKSDESNGYLFKCSGRFTKKQRASIYKFRNGSVPISTFSVPVHYAYDLVRLRYGTCCIKVWISYKG
jgi:ribosomal protein S3